MAARALRYTAAVADFSQAALIPRPTGRALKPFAVQQDIASVSFEKRKQSLPTAVCNC